MTIRVHFRYYLAQFVLEKDAFQTDL